MIKVEVNLFVDVGDILDISEIIVFCRNFKGDILYNSVNVEVCGF